MKKTTLLISLMFLAGVGQARELKQYEAVSVGPMTNLPDWQDYYIHHATFMAVRDVGAIWQLCAHDWQKTDFYLRKIKDHDRDEFETWHAVEACSKCGLIRIKPERKHE